MRAKSLIQKHFSVVCLSHPRNSNSTGKRKERKKKKHFIHFLFSLASICANRMSRRGVEVGGVLPCTRKKLRHQSDATTTQREDSSACVFFNVAHIITLMNFSAYLNRERINRKKAGKKTCPPSPHCTYPTLLLQ